MHLQKVCVLGLIVMMAASSLLLFPVSSQTPPPANGDWTVSDQTTISNQVIDLKGNLTVTATGNLTLNNVTLLFDQPSDGAYSLYVVLGGHLQVHNSNLTSKDTSKHFKFVVSGSMKMDHTNVSELWGDAAKIYGGIELRNDTVDISNCTITNSPVMGIFMNTSAPLIEYNEISHDGMIGIMGYHVVAKSPRIRHNKFHDEDNGIAFNRADSSDVSHNDFHDIKVASLLTYRDSTPKIHDNTFEHSLGEALMSAQDSLPQFYKNTVNGTSGIVTYDYSKPTISDNNLVNNTAGVDCEDHSEPIIQNNTISNNLNHGVQGGKYSKPTVLQNRILHNARTGIFLIDDSDSVVSLNEIDDNPSTGILLRDTAIATISNNTLKGNNMANIGFIGTSWADIRDNHILSSKNDGIEIQDAGAAILTNNTISGSSMTGLSDFGSANLTAVRNTITNNVGGGVGLLGSSEATLHNNTISGNSNVGIIVQSPGALSFIGNTVQNNLDNGVYINHLGHNKTLITDNLVTDNAKVGIRYVANGKLQFENNTIKQNKVAGVDISGATGGSFSNNYISNNGMNEFTLSASDLAGTDDIVIGIHDLGSVGMTVSGSNLSLADSRVQWSGTGLSVSSSRVNLTNSSFDYTMTDIRMVTSSKVWLLNTTFDPTTVTFDKSDSSSELRALWFMDLRIVDSQGRPMPGAKVEFPLDGSALNLNYAGKAPWIKLTGFTMTRLGGTKDWVHTAKVSTTTPVTDNWTFGNITINSNMDKTLVFPFAPRITDIPLVMVNEDQQTVYPLAGIVNDYDTDFANLTLGTSSHNVSVVDGSLSILYTKEIPGNTDPVTLYVSDGIRNVSKEFDIWVEPVNDPPVISSLPKLKCIEGLLCLFDLTPYLYDEEGDTLTVTTATDHVTLDGMIFKMTFPDELTNATVEFIVSDGNSEVTGNFTLDIFQTDDQPYFQGLPNVTAIEKVPKVLDLVSFMKDLDTLPEGLTILFNDTAYVKLNGTSLRFLYPDGILHDSVRIGISDGNLTSWATISVTVVPVDDPPVIKAIPDQKVLAGESTVIDLSLYLKDEDTRLSQLKVTTDSKYISIHGLNVTILYPKGQSIKKDTVNLWVQDATNKVPMHFNVTIVRQKTLTYSNYSTYLLFLVPLVIILTTVGLYAYRHVRYGWYRVKEVFLIYRDGRLIAHKGVGTKVDKEILGGMLTAVQSFAKDTVDGMGAGELKEFKYEGMRIAIERGNYVYFASIIEGYVTSGLRKRMLSLIEAVEKDFGTALKSWSGDSGELKGLSDLLKGFVKEGKASDSTEELKSYPEIDGNDKKVP